MFVDGIDVGVITEDGIKRNIEIEYQRYGSGLTGSTPVVGFVTGGIATIEATIRSYNKAVIAKCFGDVITVGTTAVDIESPFTGTLQGIITPKRQNSMKVVVYPFVTDETGAVIADTETTSVKPAVTMQEAIINGNLEIVYSTSEAIEFTVNFSGLVDPANSNRQWLEDDGIASNGTYTP